MTTSAKRQAERYFVGVTQPRARLASWGRNLASLAIPVVLFCIRANRDGSDGSEWIVILAAFTIGTIWVNRSIAGQEVLVGLGSALIIVGRRTFVRAALTTELHRWVDATTGTTTGSALLLRQATQVLVIGCKGPAPAGDDGALPALTEVRIALSEGDFHDLLVALRHDGRFRPAPSGAHGLTVSLVPSSTSASGLARAFVPFLAVVGLVNLVVSMAPSTLELSGRAMMWLPMVVAVAGVIVLGWWFQRPALPRYLVRVENDTVACLDGRTSHTRGRCALRELGIERGRYVIRSRSGRYDYPVLVLRWPGGPKMYLGSSEWRGPVDPGLPRRFFAPSLLVGPGEWDALTRALHC